MLFGALLGFLGCPNTRMTPDKIIAVSWGDGKYGEAFYGAYVCLAREGETYLVNVQIKIGRGNNMWHDCGEIARVVDDVEAVKKWGTIVWREEGVYIGPGDPKPYFLPRNQMESHR